MLCFRKWCFFSPRFGLLQDESLWIESEEADVLSVELDSTERTDGTDGPGGFVLGLARAPTDAELLHSGRQVIELHLFQLHVILSEIISYRGHCIHFFIKSPCI